MPTIVYDRDFTRAEAMLIGPHAMLLRAVAEAIAYERERCAKIVETALREDFKKKTGRERGMSEAEVFLAAAIRCADGAVATDRASDK